MIGLAQSATNNMIKHTNDQLGTLTILKCHATCHDIGQRDVKENDNPKSFTINFLRLMKLRLV